MTICVGMICSDGIVVAADTQESYASGEKSYVTKISPLSGENRKAIFAGAGLSHFIEYVKDKVFFGVMREANTPQEFETKLRGLMGRLYGDEFKKYPLEQEHKDIQLLIAVQFRKEFPVLFSVDSTLVRRVHGARVIGVETLSNMAAFFQNMKLNTSQMAWACIYIIKKAKERYEGVGGTTQIISIRGDGEFGVERSWDIPQREQALGRVDFLGRHLLVGMVPATGKPMFEATVQTMMDFLRMTRKELEHIDKEFQRALRISKRLEERASRRVEKAAKRMDAMQSASQTSERGQ